MWFRSKKPVVRSPQASVQAPGAHPEPASTSIVADASAFEVRLKATKAEIGDAIPWYPYGSLNNFIHLADILAQHPIASLTRNHRVADIGAADGELAFFMESLGYSVDVIDHAPTNFNGMRAIRALKQHLASRIEIHDVDLDAQFSLPETEYDLVFFLGILYHLKNPYYAMEHLAKRARHLFVSTRIARFTPDGTSIEGSTVAYLLDRTESNNDATNFWIFSRAGLLRLFDRTGWEVLAFKTVGDTVQSNPRDNDHDERAFALLRQR